MNADSKAPGTNSKKGKITLRELNSLTKKELKNLCEENGLTKSGNRTALFERLTKHFGLDEEDNKDRSDKEKSPEKPESSSDEPKGPEKEGSEEGDMFSRLTELNLKRDNRSNLKTLLNEYNELIKRNKESEYILIHKGIVLQYQQDYRGAVDCYMKALSFNPDNLEARMLLEGTRVLGFAKDQNIPEIEAGFELKTERGEKDIDRDVKPASIKIEHGAKVDEKSGIGLTEKSEKDIETKSDMDTDNVQVDEKGKLPVEIEETKEKTVPAEDISSGKIQIAGARKNDGSRRSLFGEELRDLDTKSLTESTTKLKGVLKELKTELGKPGENQAGEVNSLFDQDQGKMKSLDSSDRKNLDFEKQSLKDMLETRKKDDDFGSKILDSARKLLSLSSDIETDNAGPDGSTKTRGLTGSLFSTAEISDRLTDVLKENVEPPDQAEPRKQRKIEKKQIRTGNISLDKILKGGFMSGSNILIDGPRFVDKDIVLYKFATLGFRMSVPCIIVNPETAPNSIRDKFSSFLGDIKEYEEKGLLVWLDPESEEIKAKFKGEDDGEFPEMHRILLNGLDYYSDTLLENHESYNLIFFSMTPLIMFQEPKVLNKFLSRFSKRIKDDNCIALFTIDNTMHEKQELDFVKRVMDGVLEIKQEETGLDRADPKKLIKIAKIPYADSYEWHEYHASEKNFEIKAIPTYKKVM